MGRALAGTLAIVVFGFAAHAAADGSSPLDAKAGGAASMSAQELAALGDLFVEAMRLDEARKAYTSAQKLDKNLGAAELGMARIDMAEGKLEKAKNTCRAVARKFKSDSTGEICSGWVWLTFDRAARAIEEFDKAVAKGDVARGRAGLGEAYLRQMDNGKALESLTASVAAGGGYTARIALALAHEANGKPVDAISELKNAAREEPASCLAHFHLGRLLGKGAEAVTELKAAIDIRPNWSEARHQLGEALLENRDFVGAEKAFVAAIESSKAPRGTSHFGLARALHGQERDADARASLEKAIALVPNLVDAYLLLAEIAYASGDRDGSLAALERARSAAPGDVNVFLYSGLTYFKLERFTNANGYLAQAISMKPDLSLAHATLGDISCSRRLYDEGRGHYDNALKGDMKGVSSAEILKRKAACQPKKR